MSKNERSNQTDGAMAAIAIGGPIVGATAGPLIGSVVAHLFKLDEASVVPISTLACIIGPIAVGLIGASINASRQRKL